MTANKWVLPMITFVAGSLFTPMADLAITELSTSFGPLSEQIFLDTCLPNNIARVIVSSETTREVFYSEEVEILNETSYYIRNDLNRPLTNASILVHPIGRQYRRPVALNYRVLANSLTNAHSYSFDLIDSTLRIHTPVWGVGDGFIAYAKLDQPVAYAIEIYADGENFRMEAYPGCEDGTWQMVTPFEVFEYATDECGAGDSINPDGSYSCTVRTRGIQVPHDIQERHSGDLVLQYVTN